MKKILKKLGISQDEKSKEPEKKASKTTESAAQNQKKETKETKKDSTQIVSTGSDIGAQQLLVKRPWITEKATELSQYNQYIFLVDNSCNKSEAKKIVENIYGVNVVNVRSMNVPGKIRRLGNTQGRKAGYKKVIVTLEEGQTIDVLPH